MFLSHASEVFLLSQVTSLNLYFFDIILLLPLLRHDLRLLARLDDNLLLGHWGRYNCNGYRAILATTQPRLFWLNLVHFDYGLNWLLALFDEILVTEGHLWRRYQFIGAVV